MNKPALMACLAAALVSTAAHAQTIPFFNVQFEATTIAISSDGPVGFDTQAGPLGPDVVSLSADSVGLLDVATAGAIVGPGLLSTSADVSASGLSSAVASARFVGAFVNGGAVSLNIDFSGLDFASGSGAASTTLFVALTSDGVTLFEDYVQGNWSFAYAPLPGSTSVLDLTLTSDVSAAFLAAGAGNASGFGIATIAGTVPETSTGLLLCIGLGALVLVARRRTRHSVAMP